jgi:hypothetical protein
VNDALQRCCLLASLIPTEGLAGVQRLRGACTMMPHLSSRCRKWRLGQALVFGSFGTFVLFLALERFFALMVEARLQGLGRVYTILYLT